MKKRIFKQGMALMLAAALALPANVVPDLIQYAAALSPSADPGFPPEPH